METYKKPVVASKNDPSSSMVMRPLPFPLKKLLGDDDFHPENSRALTVRKNFNEK